MKKLLLLLFAFALFVHNVQAQCGPGQDTTAPVFGSTGNGTIADPFKNLLQTTVGSVPSGTYYFNFNGSTFQGELDNDTDGGGWLMILNYVHLAGDNSDLTVRNTDLPLLGSSTLGDNEAGSVNWGHMGNTLATEIDFEEMRFYGATTGHSRVIDFKTSYSNVLNYVKTGTGSFTGINNAANFTALANHTANIPAQAFSVFTNQGDLALTNFPFWRSGQAHWGIRGVGNRWEVDDFAQNTASTIHRVWVRGDLSPTATTTLTVSLDATGNATVAPEDFGLSITDNCGTANLSLSQTDFDCTTIGNNTVQLIATDDQNNSVSIDVIVNVVDTIGPVINITADLSIPFDLDPITNTFTLTPTHLGLTTPDNCGVQDVTISQTVFDCSVPGGIGITITATDIQGNVSTQNITVVISDPIPPTLNCVAPFTLFLDEKGEATITAEDLGTFSDNCNFLTFLSKSSFTCSDIGENTVTLNVRDNFGNLVSCDVVVTVDIACPTDMIVDNDSGACGAVINYTGCGTLISGLPSGSLFPIGTTNTILEITDANGITNQCSFEVTVNDTLAPSFNIEDQIITLNPRETVTIPVNDFIGPNPFAVDYTLDTSGTFDRVDISMTGTEITLFDDDVSSALPIGFEFGFYGSRYTEFYISSNGFITFSDEDEDGCCGWNPLPDDSTPNNLIAFDMTDLNPQEGGTIRYTTIGNAPNRIAIIDFDDVRYYDNTTQGTTSQIKLFEGINHIEIHGTSTFASGGGNKVQGIENSDSTLALTVPGRNADSATWSTTNDYVAFVPVSGVFENCAVDTMIVTPSTFDCSNKGNNVVTLTVTDVNGNSTSKTANVRIETTDTTAPVISLVGIDPQTIEFGSGYIELGATTDDGSQLTIDTSDFVDAVGTYTIRYNATDDSCNEAVEVTRTVNVIDTTAPVITLVGDTPQTIELGMGYTELGAITDDGTIITIDDNDFVDAIGSYTIRYNATDPSGNTAVEITRIVNVVDTTAPVIMLTGDNPQTIELGSEYTELGATTDDGSAVVIDTSAFIDSVGSYVITYNASDVSGNTTVEVTRIVNVVDTTAPVIMLTGDSPQTIELGSGYTELGATTDDGSAVVIDTSAFVDTVGSYVITYNASDVSGNTTVEVTRIVNVVDTTAPVIMLTGDNPQTIELGSGYTELGATTDDGSAVVIDASAFIDEDGSYIITYNATDASGNMADEVMRIVYVVDTCLFNTIPADNFQIQTSSETCTGKNNGIILIDANEALDYLATINNETYNFTSTMAVGNLAPGTYPVCITINGFTNCERCFEVVIDPGTVLNGKTAITTGSTTNKVYIDIESGTPPYSVVINDKIVGEYQTKSFSVEAKNGDTIDVHSSLACEGKLSTKIETFADSTVYPNPTKDNVTFSLPNLRNDSVQIEVYNTIGVKVHTASYSSIGGTVKLPMEDLTPGVYFVTINEANSQIFKIIKE